MNGRTRRGGAQARGCVRWGMALACLSLWLTGPPALAATFPDLYSITVPEDFEARDARAAAIEQGMALVLTRITGRREAGAYPELETLVDNAQRHLTSYAELDGDEIRVGFNSTAINSHLESVNWPIWGPERPLTVLWAAIDFGDGQRTLMSSTGEGDVLDPDLEEFVAGIREDLLRAADERGLPIVLPFLDAEDFERISFAGVWGGFDPLIELASARYEADTALVVRITLTELGLDVRWSVLRGGRSQTLRSSSLREGIDWLADQYADEYSVVGGARSTRISVVDVDDFRTYGRVVSYLETLSVLQSVEVEEFTDDVLTIRIASRGDDTVLRRVLTLGGVLEASDQADPLPGFGAPLVFRVVGGAARSP